MSVGPVVDSTGKTWTAQASAYVDTTTIPSALRVDGTLDRSTTPDHASLDITGDIDLRAAILPQDYTPATDRNVIVGKFDATGNQRSYLLELRSSGKLTLRWSTDGTSVQGNDSTQAVPARPEGILVRAAFDVNDGAGNHITDFFTKPLRSGFIAADLRSHDGWTALGSAEVEAGVTSIFAGSAVAAIGAESNGTNAFSGRVYAAAIFSGIAGTLAANPDWSVFGVVLTGPLGCGEWQAYITERGGGSRRSLLPFDELSHNRRLDDVSQASVTVADCQDCAAVNEAFPWQHELVLEREGDVVWAGPVTSKRYTLDSVTIGAHDLFFWMDRRLLEESFDITNDLALLFDFVAGQALARDTSPNIMIAAQSSGVSGRRINDRDGLTRAGDLLRELARTSLDFTVVGRTILVGGATLGLPRLLLTTDSFADDLTVSFEGESVSSEVTVFGASADLVRRAGGVGARTGLVQIVEQESTIFDDTSLAAAAQGRLQQLSDEAFVVQGGLTASADVSYAQLIPGVEVDLRLQVGCRDFAEIARLAGVATTVKASEESVSVTLIPPGAS